MLPPWSKYPDIPLGSLGWRMGEGEEYWYGFVDWYSELSEESKIIYMAQHLKLIIWKVFWSYVSEKFSVYINRAL